MPLSTCLYIVIESTGAWWVDKEGKSVGPFRSQDIAERSAVEIARIFGEPDRPWRVMSRDGTGHFRVFAASSPSTNDNAQSQPAPSEDGAANPDSANAAEAEDDAAIPEPREASPQADRS